MPRLRIAACRRRADRKLILVLFGGGTRFSESVGDPEHRYIPHLWKELVPRGTLLDQHAGRAPGGPSQLQCLDQDRPLGVRRPRLVEAAQAPDDLRDRPQAPQSARHGRLVVRLCLDPGPDGPQQRRGLRRAVCRQRGRAADDPPHGGRGDGAADGGRPRHRLARGRTAGDCRVRPPGPQRQPHRHRRAAIGRRPALARRAVRGVAASPPARPATTPFWPTAPVPA